MKRILLTIPMLVLAVAFNACSSDKKETVAPEAPIAVTIGKAGGGMQNAVLASGQIEASQSANISTRMMGRITSLNVKVGDVVRRGQVLATISDEDMQAKRAQTSAMIAEAEAAFAAVQKDYDRFTQLFKQQSATARELDQVTMQYNAAKSRVEAARQMRNEVSAMMAYSTLTAPFDGVVTQKMAEAGNIASPGMPILVVEHSGDLQVSAAVAESDISRVKLGDTAVVAIKSTNAAFKGHITQLNPSSQFSGGQYVVKLSIPAEARKGLYAGMFVNVQIPVKGSAVNQNVEAIMVPQSAIINREELTGIYTISNQQTALLRWVRLGKKVGDLVEVLSGLAREEAFVVQAAGKLHNGSPVKVSNQ
jgi:RND family efflux transporter MFP subunit